MILTLLQAAWKAVLLVFAANTVLAGAGSIAFAAGHGEKVFLESVLSASTPVSYQCE